MGEILLIDAEQPFADQLAGSLKGRGFSVKLLDDGKDGLDYARDNRPDLIVLCVELPKMSGYSICNKLKKDNDLKGIPLIITSKEATPETFAQHKKLKTRAEDYLIKPFAEADLVEKIGTLIPLPGRAGAGSSPPPAGSHDFDAFDSPGGDFDLGPPSGGAESVMKIDDADLSSLDLGGSTSGGSSLGLSPEDDALLASLDDLDGDGSSSSSGIGDLDLGPSVKDDALAGFEQALESIGSEAETATLRTPEPPARKPEPRVEPRIEARLDPPKAEPPSRSSASMTPTASADLQALDKLRRESSELKAKVAELEARLRAADESSRAKDVQIAAAASGGGGSSSAREVLNLKEQLRTKEKEIGGLKDEVFEKEKTNVELQEQIENVRAQAQQKEDAARQKDVELSALNAKLQTLAEERDELEEQVQGRMRQAEAERDEARDQLEQTRTEVQKLKGDLDKAKQVEERLRMDVDRAKVDLEDQKKAAAAAQARIKDLESEKSAQEDKTLKAYQRIKHEETLREKAKKAIEIAAALLNGEVETGAKSLDLDQLDAE